MPILDVSFFFFFLLSVGKRVYHENGFLFYYVGLGAGAFYPLSYLLVSCV